MELDKAVKAFCFVLIFLYLLLNYIHSMVYKYLSVNRLSRPSTIMHLSTDIDSQAKLLCPVRSEDLTSLLWSKLEESGNQVLIGNYSTLAIPNERFFMNVTQLPASDLYYSWLMIENVSEEDEGTYLCHNRWFNRTFIQVNLHISNQVSV